MFQESAEAEKMGPRFVGYCWKLAQGSKKGKKIVICQVILIQNYVRQWVCIKTKRSVYCSILENTNFISKNGRKFYLYENDSFV